MEDVKKYPSTFLINLTKEELESLTCEQLSHTHRCVSEPHHRSMVTAQAKMINALKKWGDSKKIYD